MDVAMVEYLLLSALAGTGVALIAGPLGTFVLWRRMAYFGDTLAHASLLGVALAIGLSISPAVSVALVCLVLALVLVGLERQHQLATDTVLGILSHGALAFGIVAITLIPGANVNLEGLLFGDLLTVTRNETVIIWITAAILLLLLVKYWRWLLAITVHEQLAIVDGIPAGKVKTLLMLMLALLIAIAIKIVGVLLITALLVIPPATARKFSRSPEQLAVLSGFLAVVSIYAGLLCGWLFDTPVGPSIVMMQTLFFISVLMLPSRKA